MEYCRRWGIAERVLRDGFKESWPFDVVFVTSICGRELFRFRLPGYGEERRFPFSPERNATCAQIFFDPILCEKATSLPSVSVRFMHRLDAFTEDADGIEASVRNLNTNQVTTVRARFLVGCDGGDSTVRSLADISIPAKELLNYNMNVHFSAPDLLERIPAGPAQLYRLIGPQGSWANSHMVKGPETWRLTIHLKQMPDANFDAGAYVRRAIGSDIDFKILSAVPWERRQVVADKYRSGQVLLAGDAAHQLSTTGGFGMNTGVGDAFNLGWKLAAMVEGWGGPHLLDSYEAERRPIALRNVQAASANFTRQAVLPSGPAIDDDTPEGVVLRKDFIEAIERTDVRKQFVTEGIALGFTYGESPIVCPDGTPAPPDEITAYTQTARPGSRAPHAWLSQGRSTLDLFGDGYKLLCFDAEATNISDMSKSAADQGMPLEVIPIKNKEIAGLYERRFVLVRPDGHVAWRGDTIPTECDRLIETVRGAG